METRVNERAVGLPSVLAESAGKEASWRLGSLPCSQNAHTQKVLVRCAQSEETKPHSTEGSFIDK